MRGSRRLMTALLGVGLSAFSLWLAARGVDFDRVEAAFGHVRWLPIIATLIPGSLAFVMLALRSRVMFAPVADYRFVDHLRAHFVAYFGNTILPFRIGELLRIDYLARVGNARHSACVGGLVVERLLDLGVMLLCFALSIPLTMGAIGMTAGVVGLIGIASVSLLLLVVVGRRPGLVVALVRRLSAPLGDRVARRLITVATAFGEGLSTLGSATGAAAVGMWTLARWSLAFVAINLWLLAFDVTLPWYAPIVLLASLAFGTALPSAAAFIGTYHYALSTGLGLLGVAENEAIAIAIVAHAASTVPFMLIGGLVVAGEVAGGRLTIGRRTGPIRSPGETRSTDEDRRFPPDRSPGD